MGSSGSKTVASSSSSEDASRCRCRHNNNNNNKSQPSCSSSSPSCSCLGLLRTRESHTRLHLLAGEEEREEGEDENEDKQHNQQHDDGDDNDNTTCSIPPPPPPPPPPSSGARPRFSFIPSNFTFRLTRAASFGSSSTPADPSPLPLPSSFQHHHSTPVRFSRTLSVGRLRDRVLRPSSSSPSTHHHHHHHLVEHTTDFLERRRRIRSQVRALQRLGSRFENLSGHDRSCIMAGQYRSGRCTCNRTRNLDDDTSARASISRIVMLAEALFEVLDEIHQQSVVLSSRSFVSSLGSIPAPKEVVDSMPVKIYTKLQKHQFEDVSQCYICLLEYEEGDCMRILPCHHEFHQTCIDKWLKEIHRVCPLCRGDVCRSDSLS